MMYGILFSDKPILHTLHFLIIFIFSLTSIISLSFLLIFFPLWFSIYHNPGLRQWPRSLWYITTSLGTLLFIMSFISIIIGSLWIHNFYLAENAKERFELEPMVSVRQVIIRCLFINLKNPGNNRYYLGKMKIMNKYFASIAPLGGLCERNS